MDFFNDFSKLKKSIRYFDNIILDSKDREQFSKSSTNFTIKLPTSGSKIVAFEIISIIFPYVFNTVDATNNTFKIASTTYTLPIGHYSISTLVTKLNSLTSGVATWTFEPNYRLSVTFVDLYTFEPLLAGVMFGFTQTSYTAAMSRTAENIANISEDGDYLTLHSKVLSKCIREGKTHSDNRKDIVCMIPITVPYGNLEVYQPTRPLISNVLNMGINEIDFYILDKGGNEIDLSSSSIIIDMIRYTNLNF